METTTAEQKKAQIEDRRRRVAALYLRRVRQEDIARQLKVDQSTVCRDIKAILADYRKDRTEHIDREAAELEEMEREASLQFNGPKDRRWMETRLKIKERRAKLLGLDAPTKLDHGSDPDRPLLVREYVEETLGDPSAPGGDGDLSP